VRWLAATGLAVGVTAASGLWRSAPLRLEAMEAAVAGRGSRASGDVIRLHPDNPHYFLWRGRPTVLITSGEHYGAVINLDFDYRRYLDTLAAGGLNYTRVFSGAYDLRAERAAEDLGGRARTARVRRGGNHPFERQAV
jgi:hypothetical protein